MSLKHKVLSGLMAAALSASLLACSSAPAPAASSAPASSLPSVSQNGAEHTLWHSGRIF